jgi:hypothetical protein
MKGEPGGEGGERGDGGGDGDAGGGEGEGGEASLSQHANQLFDLQLPSAFLGQLGSDSA